MVTWPRIRGAPSRYGRPAPAVSMGCASSTRPRLPRRRPGIQPPYQQLDVTILQELIFEPVLGIPAERPAAEGSITYFKDATDAFERLEAGEFQAGFFMNPTGLEQVKKWRSRVSGCRRRRRSSIPNYRPASCSRTSPPPSERPPRNPDGTRFRLRAAVAATIPPSWRHRGFSAAFWGHWFYHS